jgi:cytochrome c oxidase subunit I+III
VSELPNPLPRPAGELAALERAWEVPKGWRFPTVVNNSYIGLLYIGTALLFFVLAGVLALIIRAQLAVPENTLVSHRLYNQLFTMHGTVMMFLFAVPVVEAVAVYLLPAMLAARDLPFPRLGAYAYWCYAIGGLIFFGTIFFDISPDGGWFMYPPLTGKEYSPSDSADWWLLGIGFIEISAIAGAIELIVGILRTRAPGMGLGSMPLYAWAMLVVGCMIVFGFPPVILATLLLELERAFGWPFFNAAKGGDPVLWQHLFWLFGHPEVYIIFLPAAGMVSMMLPVMCRTTIVGYRWVVGAILGVGVLSFGLWAHHMFTTGMPHLAATLFSAASMAVAIPTGIQVFAWLATLWRGRMLREGPSWFLLAFIGVFVLGGLTGVMLAVVPFDWQVHDTHFVVAHLHYVLIGGMVFPLFAAIYYWAPMVGGRKLSEASARWGCGLMFLGVNVAFLPMHLTGMLGMPRRVHTYARGLGWDWPNLVSTVGAFLFAAGVAVVLVEVVRRLRVAGKVDANVWRAGTLEWLPGHDHGARSIPRVEGPDPLWHRPSLATEVASGQHYLPGTATGARETLVTSASDAKPQYVLIVPGPSWLPLLAGVGTAAFFLLLTVKQVWPAIAGGVLALAALLAWLWETDRGGARPEVDIGGGITLPTYASGTQSHSWWAMVVLILVDATVFASLAFSYLYLSAMPGKEWPPTGVALPALAWPAAAAIGWVAGSALIGVAKRLLHSPVRMRVALLCATGCMLGAFATDLLGILLSGLRPDQHAYGAVIHVVLAWQGFHVCILLVMALYTLARSGCGLLDAHRRVTFDNTRLFWHYTTAQGLAGILLVHLLPMLRA